MMELTTLSWVLLASNAVHNVCSFFMVLASSGAVIYGGAALVVALDNSTKDDAYKTNLPKWPAVVVGTLFVLALPLAVMPNTNQILAIAAIELSDDVLKTPEWEALVKQFTQDGD
jgi:hypothetical protein